MGESMEVGTYLRTLGWRAVLAAVLIVAAMAGPVAVVLRQPVQYVAVTAVRVPNVAPEAGREVPTEGSGEGERSQLAADLGAILGLLSTRTDLAAVTGVSVGALKDGLTVTRAGSQQYVDVSFRDTDRSRARKVANAAALRALTKIIDERLFQSTLTLADVEERLKALPAKGSAEPPLVVYRRARADESRLERLVIAQVAAGDRLGAESARRSLEEARKSSAQAAQEVLPFQRAEVDREAAEEAVAEARKLSVRLEERREAIRGAKAVVNGPVRRELPVKRAASAAIGGGLTAGIVCFGWITLAEVRSVLKRRSRAIA
jgi:uncharacterized protein involved in exopolysaccharide biosynthesis